MYFGWKELNEEAKPGESGPTFASHVPAPSAAVAAAAEAAWSKAELMVVGGVAATALLAGSFLS
jgi:hypothetical protein